VTGPAVIWRDAVDVTVYNKRCVYVQVPGKVNLRVYVIIDCNIPPTSPFTTIVTYVSCATPVAGIDVGTNGYSTGQRRIDILGSSCSGHGELVGGDRCRARAGPTWGRWLQGFARGAMVNGTLLSIVP